VKLLTYSDYNEYKDIQIAANRLKFRSVWVEDAELIRIAHYVCDQVPDARRGVCHGVRNGYEVQRLRSLLPRVDLEGTDIAESADRVPHCMTWDMHDVRADWIGSLDVMYSNSWDHSYNPALLFQRWSECLSPTGRLFLSYSDLHSDRGVSRGSKTDPFGCSCDELIRILQWNFVVEDVLDVVPSLSWRTWRQRAIHLRAGRLWRALRASRRTKVFVLSRRTGPHQRGRPEINT
jgi:hypothetical protein